MTGKRWLGIAMLLAAILAGISLIVLVGQALKAKATVASPGQTAVELSVGTWTIAQQAEQNDLKRTVNAEQLSVQGPDGSAVQVVCAYCGSPAEVLPVSWTLAEPVGTFTATVGGTYTIKTSADSGQLVVVSPEDALTQVAPAMVLLLFAGSGLTVGGLLLLLLGGRRQSGAAQLGPTQVAEQEMVNPPPGWYPNPYHPHSGSQMWWDGTKWTSHWR